MNEPDIPELVRLADEKKAELEQLIQAQKIGSYILLWILAMVTLVVVWFLFFR